jgi:hypothetical protein
VSVVVTGSPVQYARPVGRAFSLEARRRRHGWSRCARLARVSRLWFLCVAFAWAVAARPAGAAVAILSAEAPGLLPGAREALDANIHRALAGAGVDVLPLDRTARFIKDAVDAGLSCNLNEDDCALRAAVAAGADVVVVPRVVRVDNRVVMVLRQLSLDGSAPRGAAGVVEEGTGADASMLQLARRLLDPAAAPETPLPVPFTVTPIDAVLTVDGRLQDSRERKAGVLWLHPGAHLVRASAPGYEAADVVIDVRADTLPEPRSVILQRGFPALAGVGIGVAAVSGVIAGAGAVGAGVAEALLSQPLDPGLRETTQTTGRLFVATAIVGVVGIVGGATLAFVGFNE